MYHLIKKDFLMQKRYLKLSLLVALFFAAVLASLGPLGLSLSIFVISYMLVLGASAQEDKTHGDMLLASLPIKKTTIVLSKYVSVYVFAAYAILVNLGFMWLIRLLHLPIQVLPFALDGLYWALVAVTLFSSISFPLIFKWGYLKAKMANFILMFAFVLGGTTLLDRLSQSSFLNDRTEAEWLVGSVILLIILLVLSCMLSITFYKKREF
jgi:hypothetical protein